MKTIIIGASFSGLTCAYYLKKANPLMEVIILEKNLELGKKIKATGNGKCNYTNRFVNSKGYNNPTFVEYFLNEFNYNDAVNYFKELGMISKEISEGRIYPYTEQSLSVVSAFQKMINDLKIELKLGEEVIDLKKTEKGFNVLTKINSYKSDYVVVSSGGCAYPTLGTNGSMFTILKRLCLNLITPLPGLSGIKVANKDQKNLDGLRFKGLVKVFDKEQLIFEENGEIQFKNNGISGIVVMNAESVIMRTRRKFNEFKLVCDFYKDYSNEELSDMIHDNLENLDLIVPSELSLQLKKTCKNKKEIVYKLKNYEFELIDAYDFSRAQVSIGGIDVNNINQNNLETKDIKDLYIIGEALDIDGLCGGYNIHFACASGKVSGQDIGEKSCIK